MTFKEYFIRNRQVWKRLSDGSEIRLIGDELSAAIGAHDNGILAHGAPRQVALFQQACRPAPPPVEVHHIPVSQITAASLRQINAAISANDGANLRSLLRKAKRARHAA